MQLALSEILQAVLLRYADAFLDHSGMTLGIGDVDHHMLSRLEPVVAVSERLPEETMYPQRWRRKLLVTLRLLVRILFLIKIRRTREAKIQGFLIGSKVFTTQFMESDVDTMSVVTG